MIRPAFFLLLALPLVAVSAEPPAEKGGIDRTGATKKRLLKEFGGSRESEEAVMLGLAWLTQMQKQEGNWVYDQGKTSDHAAATGMAVLAFLGAGQSHKDGRYKQTVQAGLDWLVKNVETGQGDNRGRVKTISNMYSQGIATLALCEGYGMTRDPALKAAAQAAIDYIQRAQAQNGSWGYNARDAGDTSIVGWQVQALHAARLAQLDVDDNAFKKAMGFLDSVSKGQSKSAYGYRDRGGAEPATSLTAIGLLCRYYADGWRADTLGYAAGAKGLMKRAPAAAQSRPPLDLYYYYYATQVVRYYGGDEWKAWNEGTAKGDARNGGMADWLIDLQVRTPAARGSWDAKSESHWIGTNCGRLGTTCLCLLTLEVYYRYDAQKADKGK